MIPLHDGTDVLLYDPRLMPMKPVGDAKSIYCEVCGVNPGEPCHELLRRHALATRRPPHVERARAARWVEMLKL